MGNRVDLQAILEAALGSKNVYFQPPESIKMAYPCIVYSRVSGVSDYANNLPYAVHMRYQVTVIDRNPDSQILGRVLMLPTCEFFRHFTADNLNHDVYYIYY